MECKACFAKFDRLSRASLTLLAETILCEEMNYVPQHQTAPAAGPPPTEAEIEAVAVQFVWKISGYRQPSLANEKAFNQTVAEIRASTRRLPEGLVIR